MNNLTKLIAVILPGIIVLSACGLMPDDDVYPLILENHSLSGKVWDVRAGQFVEKKRLIEEIHRNEFILLGETHDNRLHHEYQSWVISNLHQSGFSALVAFEMINNAQGELIKGKQYESSGALIDDLNQVNTTWKYERRYRPVFDNILMAGYSMFPANLDRTTIMGIARKGEESIPSRIKLYLDKNVLTEEQKKALREEIKISHCGMENPHMTSAMMLTQRVKDAVMADSLMRDANVDKRVLITGSGHARNDRGVPMYIGNERNEAKVLSIAWLEVVKEITDVHQYAQRWGDAGLPFDYVWFTARTDRPDPCKSFRQHMKMKNKQKEKSLDK